VKEKFIAQDTLSEFLKCLIEEYEVLAPVARQGMLQFERISSAEEVRLNSSNTRQPPKEFFLPQSECLFCYEGDRSQVGAITANKIDMTQRVLFGVRPCDARSFHLLDRVFREGNFQDPYYAGRRERALVISMGCDQPGLTCFCTSVGSGPFDETGSDLMLIETKDGYILHTVSDRGANLLENYLGFFHDLDEGTQRTGHEIIEQAQSAMRVSIDTQAVTSCLRHTDVLDFWDAISEKCVGCSICTYLCPTCHCFDITDEIIENKTVRLRTWDSCAFPLFTLEASGFNPRPSQKERLRNRILHKFAYFPENYDQVGCVGCGRCVDACPVNLDVRQVLMDIAQLERTG
jgi:sulfhydrogenase subunit beta (sulfur reductase)